MLKNPDDIVFIPTELFSIVLSHEFNKMVENNDEVKDFETSTSFSLYALIWLEVNFFLLRLCLGNIITIIFFILLTDLVSNC